ncbi:hypothetical protein [Moorena sp. SIO3B2]|uniref:hypothetical protein n=1 Tax=Moorena sp. SIO3B2 TaxID=2607827 RepID=UPI0013CCC507|nr:hypothetical protein [Moorena sp. SIO3B2]NEP35752.1 hypothetical protein [Moorena sp. SIO3B2]
MLKKLTFVLVAILYVFCTSVSAAHADTLKYGDLVNVVRNNLDSDWKYMDTYKSDCDANYLCVSLYDDNNRDTNSGIWKITYAGINNKNEGDSVMNQDAIHLQNQYQGDGGFLDTKKWESEDDKTELHVSTAKSSNRDDNSGSWIIQLASGEITENETFRLLNGYQNYTGGHLKAPVNTGCHNDDHCVETTKNQQQDDSTFWYFVKNSGS